MTEPYGADDERNPANKISLSLLDKNDKEL